MLKVGVSCWRAQTVLLHLRSDDEDREVDFLHKVSESSLLHDLAEPRLHHNEKHVDKKRDEQANQPKTKHKNRQTRQTANKDGDHRCKQSPPPKKKKERREDSARTTTKRTQQASGRSSSTSVGACSLRWASAPYVEPSRANTLVHPYKVKVHLLRKERYQNSINT